jgi:DNA-directed RNA polymerase subunit RPC12/RpoP
MSKFKHHSYFAKAKQVQAFRFPFVCFNCRKSFKQPISFAPRKCPSCSQPMTMLSRKFSAPAAKEKQQWQKVQYLVEHGFKFYPVYEALPSGGQQRGRYPETLQEAKEFVARHQQRLAQQCITNSG